MTAEKQTTRSEVLFQHYCDERGYGYSRIAESGEQRVRSPDFSILVSENRITVEVKEITANKAEVRLWRETRSGKVVVHAREPGRRAHNQIRAAARQLRQYAKEKCPCVVVLYDNVFVDGTRPHPYIDLFGHLGPYDIDVALFGLQTANVRLHPDGTSESLPDGRSRSRKVHDLGCISAVSVLYEHPEKMSLFLLTYHNFFARTPLPAGVFAGADDRHLVKPEHPDLCPGDWTVVGAPKPR